MDILLAAVTIRTSTPEANDANHETRTIMTGNMTDNMLDNMTDEAQGSIETNVPHTPSRNATTHTTGTTETQEPSNIKFAHQHAKRSIHRIGSGVRRRLDDSFESIRKAPPAVAPMLGTQEMVPVHVQQNLLNRMRVLEAFMASAKIELSIASKSVDALRHETARANSPNIEQLIASTTHGFRLDKFENELQNLATKHEILAQHYAQMMQIQDWCRQGLINMTNSYANLTTIVANMQKDYDERIKCIEKSQMHDARYTTAKLRRLTDEIEHLKLRMDYCTKSHNDSQERSTSESIEKIMQEIASLKHKCDLLSTYLVKTNQIIGTIPM